MGGPVYDFEDGNFIYPTSGGMGFDTEGHMHMRMGDNMSMDMETGDIHFNSGWKEDRIGMEQDDEW